MSLPPVGDLLAGMRVVAIPMRVRFRGVSPARWRCSRAPGVGRVRGLPRVRSRRGLALARVGHRDGVRALAGRSVGGSGQRHRAGRSPERRRGDRALPRVHDGQGQGRRARAVSCRRRRAGGRGACGDGALGKGARRRQRGLVGGRRRRRPAAARRYDLEYAEQPCATVEELRDLRIALARAGVDVPVAADESIRKAEDPLRVRDLEAADLIVVKVAPLGGVRSALRVVEECGLPAVVSSALDTSVGISPGWRSPPRCLLSTTPAVWERSRCSRATSPATRWCPWRRSFAGSGGRRRRLLDGRGGNS